MNAKPHDLERLAEVRDLYATGRARQRRLDAHVTQAEFARGIGASRAAVCLWEAGERTPSNILALRAWSALEMLSQMTSAPRTVHSESSGTRRDWTQP